MLGRKRFAVVVVASCAMLSPPAISWADPRCGEVRDGGRIAVPAHMSVPVSCAESRSVLIIGNRPHPVPLEGWSVTQSELGEQGVDTVEITTSVLDGALTIDAERSETGPAVTSTSAGTPAECSDTSRNFWVRNKGWSYQVNSTADRPANVTATDWLSEIDWAHSGIDSLRNDCGLPQNAAVYNTSITLVSTTSTARSMTSTGACFASRDSKNVVDFGPLPSGVLARACRYKKTNTLAADEIDEADVRLNKAGRWFRYIPSSCVASYEMAGALLHEFGHVFGMDHVSETTSPGMTMSESGTPCSYADSYFGHGDHLNMTERYSL